MKNCVIPTVFSKNIEDFERRLNRLIEVSNSIQIDIMDGKFVSSKGIKISDIPNLKKHKISFEAHLMVYHPELYIDELAEKGFKKVIFHYESIEGSSEIKTLIEFIRGAGLSPWMAINPQTQIWEIIPFLHMVEGILFMGVNPGKEKQKFISKVIENIEELHSINPTIKIQVDGGVRPENASLLRKSGVSLINSGSYISDARSPKIAINKLNKSFLS
jgi:ribulose-phosphate 3-epimerase